MKVKLYHWYNAVLTSLLALLGYGCSLSEPELYGTPVVEYGTPTVRYSINGEVTDEDGNPIKNIKASVKAGPYEEGNIYHPIDSTKTDENGTFTIDNLQNFSLGNQILILEDLDGEENGGQFLSDTLQLDKLDKKKVEEEKSAWDAGKCELTGKFYLKKEKQ